MLLQQIKLINFTRKKKNVKTSNSGTVSAPVREMFESCGFYKFVPKENFYPTIRDAVNIARQRQDA